MGRKKYFGNAEKGITLFRGGKYIRLISHHILTFLFVKTDDILEV